MITDSVEGGHVYVQGKVWLTELPCVIHKLLASRLGSANAGEDLFLSKELINVTQYIGRGRVR